MSFPFEEPSTVIQLFVPRPSTTGHLQCAAVVIQTFISCDFKIPPGLRTRYRLIAPSFISLSLVCECLFSSSCTPKKRLFFLHVCSDDFHPFTSNNKLTRWGSRHLVLKQRIHPKSGGRARPCRCRQRGAVTSCWDLFLSQFGFRDLEVRWPVFKKKSFHCINFKANRTIRGIGLLCLSLYFVIFRFCATSKSGKRDDCCQKVSALQPQKYEFIAFKPVWLLQDKAVRMVLIAPFLSCTSGCGFPPNSEILPFFSFLLKECS